MAAALATLATCAVASCNAILGFDRGDRAPPAAGGAGGAAGAGGTTSAAGHGGAGGLGGGGAASWNVLWAGRYGGPESDCGRAVAAGSDGVVFAGDFRDSADFGQHTLTASGGGVEPDVDDMFVAKRVEGGSVSFAHGYGTDGLGEQFNAVSVHGSNLIALVGQFRYTIDFGDGEIGPVGLNSLQPVVLRLGSAGQHLASDAYGVDGAATGTALAWHPENLYFIAGWFAHVVSFGGSDLAPEGGWDMYIAAFNHAGDHIWSRSLGGLQQDIPRALAAVDDGVVVVGQFQGEVHFDDQILDAKEGTHAFVAKLNDAGKVVWVHSYGDDDPEATSTALAVATDLDGNIIVTGEVAGSVQFGDFPSDGANNPDLFVVKLDPSGTHLWSKRYAWSNGQRGRAVVTRPSGNVIVAGMAAGSTDFDGDEQYDPLPIQGGYDAFVLELTGEGEHVASTRFGSAGQDLAMAAAVDGDGHVWLTGCFDETMFEGTEHELQSAGASDIFLVELSL